MNGAASRGSPMAEVEGHLPMCILIELSPVLALSWTIHRRTETPVWSKAALAAVAALRSSDYPTGSAVMFAAVAMPAGMTVAETPRGEAFRCFRGAKVAVAPLFLSERLGETISLKTL